MATTDLSKLLAELADAVGALPSRDLSRVLTGEARLVVRVVPAEDSSARAGKDHAKSLSGETLRVARHLESLDTREAGHAYLETVAATKADLLAIARHLDLPAQKRDSRARLQEKVVEATIGFRIRSAAIQGATDHENE